jgi:hypothetical protein
VCSTTCEVAEVGPTTTCQTGAAKRPSAADGELGSLHPAGLEALRLARKTATPAGTGDRSSTDCSPCLSAWRDASGGRSGSLHPMATTSDSTGATSSRHQATDRGAAFFDLDRTLLRGASGRVYGEALRRVGLGPRRTGIEDLVFGIFDTIGETLPAMFITRQGVRATKGWSQAKVQEAAEWAAPHLADILQPWAHQLFDEHREAGRPLVMATTTPYDLVAPLAEALGPGCCGGHPVRDRWRGSLHRPGGGSLRVGPRQAPSGGRVGRGSRHRSRCQLCLQRQLL